MKRISLLHCALVAILCISGSLLALDIQVSPQMLVISSNDGKFTVHTDVSFTSSHSVTLEVNGTTVDARIFADNRGNLVVQCSKDAVVKLVSFDRGNTTTATVTLTVDGVSDSEVIRVRE